MKLYTFLLTFLFLILSAQNQEFLYNYRSIPDSTQRNQIQNEVMVLNIQGSKSEFYSLERYQSDSTLLAASKKGLMLMPPNKRMSDDRIIKNDGKNEVEFYKIVGYTKFFVTQPIQFKWNLQPEFDKILGYDVQKATTDFGGRKWIAWFSKDIPIQDGPYKFFGLPGLILKIEDTTKSHSFEIQGIRKSSESFVYPELNNFQIVKVSYPQFLKAFKNERKSPGSSSIGKLVDYTDSTGKLVTAQEVYKNIVKRLTEIYQKDNNMIELDLLK